MLVCRDLEKLRKYGFNNNGGEYYLILVNNNDEYVGRAVVKNNCLSVFTDREDSNDLDFLYDMIKDGVIEKVAE